ncbi:MAG TPA: GNAT family N-acetyltransferase [Chitinophagaceae bacterium]|nr:GNAT family N-acetyltransferase [Chitinophagaceae bacterium]
MITLTRTDSAHPDFAALVRQLDTLMAELDGEEHAFYDQFNKIDKIRHVVLAFYEGAAVGCGAIREIEPGIMEVKRMYTVPPLRGQGIATRVIRELENWARELGAQRCVLETGKRQPDAVAVYRKNGYHQIPNYGQYAGVDNSLCFEKTL